jgi:hypothetical protein
MPPPSFKADDFRIHPGHDAAYRALEDAAAQGQKPQQAIWKRFQAARLMLAQDPLWGEVIRGPAIPTYFRDTYDVQNLYCIDLKGDVRCFYTIDERDVIFLDIVDHDQYDKWFAPKGQKRRR